MFTDIRTSRDTLADFRARMTERGTDLGLDLTVQVLTTGSWPTQSNAKCALPAEMERCCEEFRWGGAAGVGGWGLGECFVGWRVGTGNGG